LRGVQADDAAKLRPFGVFFAVADVHKIAIDHWRAVDSRRAEEIAPDVFAGGNLKSVDAAIRSAADEQPLVVDDRDDGCGIIAVLDLAAGFAPPADGAGFLVKGDEAVAAAGLFAPASVDHAEDEQVAVNDRAGDAAAVAADPAVFLGHRMRPENLA